MNKHENFNVFVQKYKCNGCKSYYRSDHDSLVAKYSNHVHEVNEYIKELFSRVLISKNNVSKIINTVLDGTVQTFTDEIFLRSNNWIYQKLN
ncbi:MAG: hypothetical protein LBT10_09980 [Methanobrevibacter sp.]|nr:hypothetical protein [Methanobrevibacter sp.]